MCTYVPRFNSLGVKLSNPNDADSIEKLALVMFDTRTIKVSGETPLRPGTSDGPPVLTSVL